MQKAIIVFVRNPVLGKVKTRLAKGIGDVQALQVYTSLLKKTHKVIKDTDAEKFVFYADGINNNDLWENDLFHKVQQTGNDLGERMYNAFTYLFDKGYSKVLIIGSDCPALETEIVEEAFLTLNSAEVVIGPTFDGGYYLLGLKKAFACLFTNKQWSTETVYQDTMQNISELNLSYAVLKQLSDIDTIEDWLPFKDLL
ncbi:TIGR04282 family arsenosugar biosynthesis glycosyltransferase [Emticicia agri]|uniref:Glycosyltransferase n=1 Tax=Emticicia agri TaxID=2492393 RepID=A0A4Q5LV11_9BACT|nr:TIGR04282 family arsenosugar biosynthesis glycosyltransferase [Emticicia agri]RYU93337.1 glycosyltransferase [Emticicia agri]